MTESILDRKAVGKLTLEQVAYLVVFLLAVFLRTYDLGLRPYHHDESIHAFFSWKITQQGLGDYRYDPVYHGPVLYYSTALMLWLFGDNDFTGRLSAVLFGLGVVAFAWPLRRYLGRWGAISFLVLVSFSPSWTYFTRFVRHDIYLALCNLAAVYYAFRYGETRRPRHLYVSAAAISLAFCNKEDMYLIAPIFLASLGAMVLWPTLRGEQKLGAALAETGRFLRSSLLPILTSLVIFAIVWAVLYTSFGHHPENWNAVGRALEYWWGQQQIKRIGGPWYYYVPELVLYEPLITFPALAVIVGAFSQRPSPDPFLRFSVVWTIGTLGIYAWAQEKVPWLLIPQLLPLTILSARWFGQVIEKGTLFRPAALIPATAVGALTIWTLISSNFLYDAPKPDQPADDRRETMLSYVQSTYDIHKVMGIIEEAGRKLETGTQTRLAVSGNATWPFSWYLRHYQVNWAANVRNIDFPIVIVDKEVAKSTDEALLEVYERVPFAIRGWWEPSRPTLPQLFRFLITRQAWSPVGSSDAVLYVHKDLKPGMTFATLTVNPPPAARGYPRKPEALEAVASWGSRGSKPGQFEEPRGLALDGTGNLYVVDSKNNRIQKLSPTGDVLKVWGAAGSEPGQFKDPGGIAVGPDGSVYVADTWNHRIQKFDPDGNFIRQWNAKDPGFWGPRGVTVSDEGRVYVTDTGNKRVVPFTTDGLQFEAWGSDGSAPGQFIEPVGVVALRDQVIVADTGNRRLQVFLGDGTIVKEWPVFGWEEFYTEPHLALLGDDIIATDSHNHRFARYRDGKLLGVWGKTGASRTDLNRPIGIATAEPNVVFISDTMNHRIQKYEIPEPSE
jgi:uncharacterized protein (TIGR03663 family)